MLTVLLFLVSVAAGAKDLKEFRVQHFGDESLPQLTIMDVEADQDGFLWIATQMGLVRFDGQQFRVFTPDNTPALKSVRCIAINKDGQGKLYLIDAVRNLYELTRSGPRPASRKGMETAHNYCYRTGGSPVWSDPAANNGQPFYYKETAGTGHADFHIRSGKDSIHYHFYDADKIRPRAFLWNRGAVLFQPDLDVVYLKPGRPPVHGIKITGDLSLKKLDKAAVNTSRMANSNGRQLFYIDSSIYELHFDGRALRTTLLISHIDLPGDIKTFYYDERNGYYAIATLSQGLYLLHPNSFATKTLDAGPQANIFYAVERVRDNIYIAASGYVFDLYRHYERHITQKMDPYALFRLQGRLLSSGPGAIDTLDLAAGTLRHLIDLHNGEGWLQRGLTDRWGRTWLATFSGVARYREGRLEWLPVLTNRLKDYYIENIWFADSNTLWLGLRDGLYTYDLATRSTSAVPEMKGTYIRNFIDDGRDGLWILTYGKGYYHYDRAKFARMPLDAKERLATVHAMLPDARGYYWMPTNKGLFRVKRAQLLAHITDTTVTPRYEYFGKENGFLTNEFNGGCNPCGNAVSDSLMLLPSMNGLVYFNPLAIRTAPLSAGIFIDHILIDGKKQAIAGRFALPTDFSAFECVISTPYFGDKDNLVLEYRVDGLAGNWQPLVENRSVRLSRLPYGKYIVHIRKITDFDTNAATETTITLLVAAPWYLHAWFLVLCVLLALAVFGLILWLRVRMLNRQKHRLEVQIAERTEQLRNNVRILEQSQADLYRSNRFKEQLTSIILHDVQTPLRFLKRVVKNIVHIHETSPARDLSDELNELYHATDEVAAYTESFLAWIKMQQDNFRVVRKQISLCALLEEIDNLYQKIASAAGASIRISCAEEIRLCTDPDLLSIVVRNLIDNAIKYAPKGLIAIEAAEVGQMITIRISDNGIGMQQAKVAQLLSDTDDPIHVASGKLGYQFIRDILRMLNGTMAIESAPQQGTTVILTFTSQ